MTSPGAGRMDRARVLTWAILGLAGTVLVFLFSYRFVLHHFATGPHFWDSGWYADAIFQNGFLLPNLPYLRNVRGDSVFTQHIYGLASLASPLSHLFRTHYHYFASVLGGTYALAFLGPFLAVMALRKPGGRSIALSVVALTAGLAFAFSGPIVSAIGYPHFETAIPCFFVLFLAMHFLGWRRTRWLALCLGLIVREDAGLHYFGYFALIALGQWWSGQEAITKRTLVAAMGLSIAVSVAMLVAQRQFFPFGDSMFVKTFVGQPPFAHVTVAAIEARVGAFLVDGPHLYVPMLVVVLAALMFRAPILALGYAACLPWMVMNVVFNLIPAGQTLSLYYGFPLLVGLAWLLVAPHWMPAAQARARQLAIATFFVATGLSLALLEGHAPVTTAAIAGADMPASVFLQQNRCLEAAFRAEPRLFADIGVLAMFPKTVPRTRVLGTGDEIATVNAQGLLFYDNHMAPMYLARARALGLGYETTVAVPRIRIVSRDPSSFAACMGLVVK